MRVTNSPFCCRAGVMLLAGIVVVAVRCGGERGLDPAGFSTPVIVFEGRIDGEVYEFPGSRRHPNRCVIDEDTVKMTFYTADYAAGSLPSGMYLRLHVYLPLGDSTRPDPTLVGRENLFFKMGIFSRQEGCSYEVGSGAGESLQGGSARFAITLFEPVRGGRVELERGELRARAMDPFCGFPLQVEEARIGGRVE